MEQWEIDLRKELDDIFQAAEYVSGEMNNAKRFDKNGMINHVINQEKRLRKIKGFYNDNSDIDKSADDYQAKFKKFIKDLDK